MSTIDSSVSVFADRKVLRTEIVFIESNVDYQSRIKGIDPAKEIHVRDAGTDGLTQIAQILAGRSGIDAIHIISHGSTGAVQFGGLTLDDETAAKAGRPIWPPLAKPSQPTVTCCFMATMWPKISSSTRTPRSDSQSEQRATLGVSHPAPGKKRLFAAKAQRSASPPSRE